jgi:two-component system, OmpR family, KDP operon response regulator KdpE
MERSIVIVVNDEVALRNFFRFNLKARGFEVYDVTGCPEVLELVEEKQPDIVILDLMVRDVDGFALCKQICEMGTSSVIALNMRGSESDLIRCLDMGVADYLNKPFGVDELLARINAVLRHQRWLKTPAIV